MSVADEAGRLYLSGGHLLRAIRPTHSSLVRRLFDCGLIAELTAAGLFPASRITDRAFPGFDLVVGHETIEPVTYPKEWSFSMLRDAAITLLRVNRIASRYGFQTKDAHAHNIVFKGASPMFVDLGSFVPVAAGYRGFLAQAEFAQAFLYPLALWRSGDAYTARQVLVGSIATLMPHESFLMFRSQLLRALGPRVTGRLARAYFGFRGLSTKAPETILKRLPGAAGRLVLALVRSGLMPGQSFAFERAIRRLERQTARSPASRWHRYQHGLRLSYEQGAPDTRFARIVELMSQYPIGTVTELAGNEGVFAEMLLDAGHVRHVICTDRDAEAVDELYAALKRKDRPITPAVLDVLAPPESALEIPVTNRFASDAVVALAFTHHLILGQNIAIDVVLDRILRYGRRFVVVEFMPLGLYAGQAASVPRWYTVDWFRDALSVRCDVLCQEQIEPNRILFVAERRDAPDSRAEGMR